MVSKIIKSPDEIKTIYGVRNDEKETSISLVANDDMAILYTNDNVFLTKMKKRFAKNTTEFTCEEFFNSEDGEVYSYKFTFPKKYVSIRTVTKEVSDEQRKAASKRFKEMWAKE